jgi:hypothetical protein
MKSGATGLQFTYARRGASRFDVPILWDELRKPARGDPDR